MDVHLLQVLNYNRPVSFIVVRKPVLTVEGLKVSIKLTFLKMLLHIL